MKTSQYYFLILSSILYLSMTSCNKSGQKLMKKHDFSSEHYQKLGNNLNRIVEMRTGVFVQYLYDETQDSIPVLWRINNGTDSTVIIARSVGNPNKDGHWVLTYTFMSNAPELPLSVTLELYEASKTSRDTIYCYFHNAPETINWTQISDKNYKFNDLVLEKGKSSRNQYITLARQNLMEFEGPTNFRDASLYAEKYNLRKDDYIIKPEESRFAVSFFEEKGADPWVYPAVQVLKKLPYTNIFYPNSTIIIKDK